MSNSSIVNELMSAWNSLDLDRIMDCFTEDAEYANVPMGPPSVGKADIRSFIEGFLGTTSEIEFIVHNQVDDGSGVVMNERTDIIVMDGNRIEVRVMGVFEIENGLIRAWRDYFDMGAFS